MSCDACPSSMFSATCNPLLTLPLLINTPDTSSHLGPGTQCLVLTQQLLHQNQALISGHILELCWPAAMPPRHLSAPRFHLAPSPQPMLK